MYIDQSYVGQMRGQVKFCTRLFGSRTTRLFGSVPDLRPVANYIDPSRADHIFIRDTHTITISRVSFSQATRMTTNNTNNDTATNKRHLLSKLTSAEQYDDCKWS